MMINTHLEQWTVVISPKWPLIKYLFHVGFFLFVCFFLAAAFLSALLLLFLFQFFFCCCSLEKYVNAVMPFVSLLKTKTSRCVNCDVSNNSFTIFVWGENKMEGEHVLKTKWIMCHGCSHLSDSQNLSCALFLSIFILIETSGQLFTEAGGWWSFRHQLHDASDRPGIRKNYCDEDASISDNWPRTSSHPFTYPFIRLCWSVLRRVYMLLMSSRIPWPTSLGWPPSSRSRSWRSLISFWWSLVSN